MRFLRAFILTLLVNIPNCVLFMPNYRPDLWSFTEPDEIYYLQAALDIAQLKNPRSFYLEESTSLARSEALTLYASAPLDYLIGSVGVALGSDVLVLGVFLDFITCFFSILIFSSFFNHFIRQRWIAECAAFVTLFITLPLSAWLHYWPLNQFREYLVDLSYLSLVGPEFIPRVSVSVLRAVYTQVSYPLFGLSLLCAAKSLVHAQRSSFYGLLAGLIGGILLNVYFFAWGAAVGVIGLSFLLWIQFEDDFWHGVRRLACFGIAWVLGSSPGLLLLPSGQTEGLGINEHIRDYFYFSPLNAILVLLFLLGLYWFKLSTRVRAVVIFSVSALVAELVLMNLQPVLGILLSPFHFPVLYLQPLLQGCFVSLFFLFLIERLHYQSLSSLIGTCLVACGILGFVLYARDRWEHSKHDPAGIAEVSRALGKVTPKNAVIATPSFVTMFESSDGNPYWVMPNLYYALTKRKLLHQYYVIAAKGNHRERVAEFEREHFLGWIFSGKVQEVYPCSEEAVELPGDIFAFVFTAFHLRRASDCRELSQEIGTLCELLGKYRLDYVLWPVTYGKPTKEVEPFLSEVWSSEQHSIFQFDQSKALEDYCDQKNKLGERDGA